MDKGRQRHVFLKNFLFCIGASQVVLVVNNLPTSAGHVRDVGSIPGSGRSHGEGNGNPFQYSCLENPMDRGTWQATVHDLRKKESNTI